MNYALSVEIKLVELPDEALDVTMPSGGDPVAGMVKMLSNGIQRPAFNFGQAAGFDFRKTINLSLAGFPALAELIGRFDNLVADIEMEKLSAKL